MPVRSLKELQNFKICSETGLFEVKSFGAWYTWANNRTDNSLVMERLDKAFCNEMWLSQYLDSHVICLPIAVLDHSLLIFNTNHQQKYKKHIFHFQNYWLTDQTCQEIVANEWNKSHYGSLAF